MALESTRTIKELAEECESRRLHVKPTGKNGKYLKEDYIRALRADYLVERYGEPDGVPFPLRFMLTMDCPMLCKRYAAIKKQSEQIAVWKNDGKYAVEEKIDGSRSVLCWDAERQEFDFYSRHNSVTDFLPISYKSTIRTFGTFTSDTNFVLDCEIIATNSNTKARKTCTTQLNSTSALLAMNPAESFEIQKDSPLMFVIFDCLYDGIDLRSLPWKERHPHAERLAKELSDAGFLCKINPYVLENKRDFYENIIRQGGEGCFSGETRILMADMTMKQIKDICVGDEVMSYDGQNICKSTVERVFDNGIADADLFWRVYPSTVSKVRGGGHLNERFEGNMFHAFNVTKNHKFYTKGDFEPLDQCGKITKIGYRLDHYRYEALCGWLLSDGHIDKRNVINITQRDGEYMKFSEEMFERFKTKTKSFISGKNSPMKVFYILKDLTKDFVRTGTVDEFKRELAKTITPIRFAYMLMGDGYGDEKSISISTEGMSEETLNVLMNTMKSLGFPIGAVHKDKRVHNGAGCGIRFHKEVATKLIEWCGAYVHPSMRYKIEKLGEIPDFIAPPDVVPVLYEQDFTKVSKELTHHKYRSRRYDIEVASTHCYFAEGVLVHNCVFKRVDAPYTSTTSRTNDMIKIKRTIQCDLLRDLDAWVSGFTEATKGKANENYIGGLCFSVKIRDKDGNLTVREIGRVAGIPQELRVEMTDYDDNGNPKLKQEYYGRVATLSGQDISGVNMRITHCTLKEWRPDKGPSDCETLEMSELEKLIL